MCRYPYERYTLLSLFHLWGERSIRSIANLKRRVGEEFLAIAPKAGIKTEVETYKVEHANEPLERLRSGAVRGVAALVMS